MEESAKHLFFHGTVILLLALLSGIPYGRSLLKKQSENIIFAWRVAHSSLTMGAILMFSLVPILSLLVISVTVKELIALFFIVSAYSFSFALYLSPLTGYRGLHHKGPFLAKAVYFGNFIGALTSTLGALILLYAAWQTL
jgi:glucan phosphoethanolaminetransferase (alkaline phosphatase superfamily)